MVLLSSINEFSLQMEEPLYDSVQDDDPLPAHESTVRCPYSAGNTFAHMCILSIV